MGAVTKVLHLLQKMSDIDLLNRYTHIIMAQAVREYLGSKEDRNLTIEIRLAHDEIVKRMFKGTNGSKII